MDNVFGSPQLNRKVLKVNRRTGIKQEFLFDHTAGYKSDIHPRIAVWKSRGKGVQGETINSTNNAARSIVNRNWKPLQS